MMKIFILLLGLVVVEVYARLTIGVFKPLWLGEYGTVVPYLETQQIVYSIALFGVFFFAALVKKQNRYKYGAAKWASNRKINRLGIKDKTGVVLGKHNGQMLKSGQPLSSMLIAPPGTGKTTGFVVPTILSLDSNSMIVNDPKGELYEMTSGYRRKFGDVVYFDPTNPNTSSFNPLAKEFLEHGNSRDHVERIANALIKENKDDDYWTKAGRQLFQFFANWLIHKNGETSFGEIRDKYLSQPDIPQTIEEMLLEEDLPKNLIMDGNSVLQASAGESQWAGVTGTLNTFIDMLSNDNIRKATSGSPSFTAQSLRSNTISVYMVVREQDRARLAPLIRLIFELVGSGLISKQPTKDERMVTLILDEFPALGRLTEIKDLPARSRGYGVNLMFICQGYEQISETYGDIAARTFDDNCAYRIVLATNSLTTARRVSELIGDATDIRISTSHRSTDLMQGQTSQGQEALRLVKPNDITSLQVGEGILLVQHHNNTPVRIKVPFFFKEKQFSKIINKYKTSLPSASHDEQVA